MWAVVGGFSLHVLLLSLPFSPDQKNPVLLFIIHLLLLTQKEYICYSCKFQTFSCVTCGKMIVNRARITLKFSHPIDWSQVSSFLFHYIHVNTTSLVLKKKKSKGRITFTRPPSLLSLFTSVLAHSQQIHVYTRAETTN